MLGALPHYQQKEETRMTSGWMRAVGFVALAAPATAIAFETVDTLPYPSMGRFPAWPGDTVARPIRWWAHGGLMYDDNVLRRPTGQQSEIIGRFGAGILTDIHFFERQSLVLEAVGEYYDYKEFDDIDHFAYALRGEWFWELGNQLSGTAGYTRRRRQVDLAELQAAIPDIVIEDRAFLTGAWRFSPRWRLAGAAEYARADREAEDEADLNRATVRGSFDYVSPLGNVAGVEYRVTRGDAPVEESVPGLPTAINNDFDEREIALVMSYALGAQLRVGGRLGHTEVEYTELPNRDFSGTTYRLRADWVPVQKLILTLEAYREPASIIDVSASHVLRTGAGVGAAWAIAYKLVFRASFLNEDRVNQADPALIIAGTPVRDETLRTWRFGLGWEPQRFWQIGAGFDIGERTSNEVGRDYDYKLFMVNVRYAY
jgi:hypothetical protein